MSEIVGVGRPFIYASSSYGTEGVEKALQILQVSRLDTCSALRQWLNMHQDEFEMNMRLIGAKTLKDIVPDMVDTTNVSSHIVAVPGDHLYNNNCKPIHNWSRSRLLINFLNHY
jgi:L-lactate dehydrogenase (cytochrome)